MPTNSSEVFNAADYLLSQGDPVAPAVSSPRRTLSYAELAYEACRFASGLQALGVRPEERVVFYMVDDVELVTGVLGTMLLGAVAVPLSTMVTVPDLVAMLTDSRARVCCVSKEFTETAKSAVSAAPAVTDVVLDRADPAGFPVCVRTHRWADVTAAGGDHVAPAATDADSPALWLYTSGTTGQPKGAIHRHASIRAVCSAYAHGVLSAEPRDRFFSIAKLFFAYGIGNSLFFPLASGGTSLLDPARPTPDAVAARVRADRPTLFFGVPTFFAALLNSDIPDDTFASVRHAVSAGEPLPVALHNRFRDRFGVEILDGIGSTEALHIFLSNRPGSARPGSTGTPVPGYAAELRDERGAVVDEFGRPGELFVSGPSIASGYWSRYETTKRVFQGEWLRTGDSFVRNVDGTFTSLGRLDDMIKAGGIWVSPAEVEEVLLRHPAVAQAAVVTAPDADGLEKPVACLVAAGTTSVEEAELIEFCRAQLAAFKRPRAVLWLDEMPTTANGKIRRNVLRERVRDTLSNVAESTSLPEQVPA
ncbi:benzoate-CoA ligase family protein [Saccharopolyspora sp. NPDC003752]